MRFLSNLFFTFIFCVSTTYLHAQCATLNQTATLSSGSCAPGISPCTVCPGNTITLSGSGQNLTPGSCVNWYYSTTPGFNPNAGQGTLMGCSPIAATPVSACNSCPVLSYMFADACGTEQDNEYMILLSGSGFVTDQLSVNYDAANNLLPLLPSRQSVQVQISSLLGQELLFRPISLYLFFRAAIFRSPTIGQAYVHWHPIFT
jgi:hypothetical protein